MNNFGASIATVVGLFVTLAIVSVALSNRAQTGQVIKAFGDAVSSIIGSAVKPVTG